MRPGRAILNVMPRVQLDADTADRMLSGRLDPADVPPGYQRVSELLQALTLPATPQPAPARGRSVLVSRPARVRLSTAAIVAACCLGGATAAYAAGLPQTASDTASSILSKLGVNTGSGSHGGKGHTISAIARDSALTGAAKGAAVSAAASGGKAGSNGSDSSGVAATNKGKGSTISQLATTTTATGVAKGAVISTAASAGQSRAGTQVGGPAAAGSTGITASASGRAQAASSSDGHSSGGSGSTAR
ncbi:MAG: hypothetical protein QOI17_33 [Gaiellales bacterium]|nr:hypothetical protein [Gaiellales bacterium]